LSGFLTLFLEPQAARATASTRAVMMRMAAILLLALEQVAEGA
jgi:hypothetical protein